jgi:hypothetical protein
MRITLLGVRMIFFRGATTWEGQIGPYWFSVNHLRFWWTVSLRDIAHFGREMD